MMRDTFDSIPALRRHLYVCVLLLALGGAGHTWLNHAVSETPAATHAPLNANSEQMKGIEDMLR